MTKEEFKEFLNKGVVANIFRIERNIGMHREIAGHAESLGSVEEYKSYNRTFGLFQQVLYRDVLLLTSILFEKERKYPIRSLPSLLDKIQVSAQDLSPIIEKVQLRAQLLIRVADEEQVKSLLKGSDSDITENLLGLFNDKISGFQFQDHLEIIKTARDTRIAHDQIIEIEKWPSFNDVMNVVDYCKWIVGVITCAYLGTIYAANENYLLSNNAMRAAIDLRNVFEKLGVQKKW